MTVYLPRTSCRLQQLRLDDKEEDIEEEEDVCVKKYVNELRTRGNCQSSASAKRQNYCGRRGAPFEK